MPIPRVTGTNTMNETGYYHDDLHNAVADHTEQVHFDVKAYGAVGDGVTADDAAIQDAIDAAYDAGGGVVWVPVTDAFYRISSTVYIRTGVTLRGGGQGSYLKADADFGNFPVIENDTGAYDITDDASRDDLMGIEGLKIDGNGQNNTTATEFAHGIALYGPTRTYVRDCYILNTCGDGIMLGAKWDGSVQPDGVTLEGNHVWDFIRNGISLVGGENVLVHNNHIHDYALHPVTGLSKLGDGIDIEPDVGTMTAIDVSANTVVNTFRAGISVGGTGSVVGCTIHHNTVDTTTADGSGNYGYGIDVVEPNVVVDSNIIKGVVSYGVFIEADYVTVSNNNIVQPNPHSTYSYCIRVAASYAQILGNDLTAYDIDAIRVESVADYCVINGNKLKGLTAAAGHLRISGGNYNIVQGNILEGFGNGTSTTSGMMVTESGTYNKFIGNTVTGFQFGIAVSQSSTNNEFLDNETTDNQYELNNQYATGGMKNTIRSQERQVGVWVNVKDYGAKGDGTTDDTAAIQAVLNLSPVARKIFFPAGTYYIATPLSLSNHHVILSGAGNQFTMLKPAASSSVIEVPNGRHGLIFRDLAFIGTNGTPTENGISFTGTGGTGAFGARFENCRFEDLVYAIDSNDYGMETTGLTMIECQFTAAPLYIVGAASHNYHRYQGCRWVSTPSGKPAVRIDGVSSAAVVIDFDHCDFEGNANQAVQINYIQGINFTSCYFETNDTAASGKPWIDIGTNVAGLRIQSCYFNDASDELVGTSTGATTSYAGAFINNDFGGASQDFDLTLFPDYTMIPGLNAIDTQIGGGFGTKVRIGRSSTAYLGFYGATPTQKLTVTGVRASNTALASLLTQLATLGLITDSTTES